MDEEFGPKGDTIRMNHSGGGDFKPGLEANSGGFRILFDRD